MTAAYLDLAAQLEQMATEAVGQDEALWPARPGPRELLRLAKDTRTLVKYRFKDLPDRQPRGEILAEEPALAALEEQIDPIVEEALLELWPGRPSDHTLLTQEEWTQLQQVLALMAPGQRRAFLLVKGQGLSHWKAAAELGVRHSNVDTQLQRARETISHYLSGRKEGHLA